jgi:transcription elongation factor Elf1
MTDRKKPTTVTCPHCKNEQVTGIWVAAHWNQSLVGTCVKCGKKFNLRAGKTWK